MSAETDIQGRDATIQRLYGELAAEREENAALQARVIVLERALDDLIRACRLVTERLQNLAD